MPDMPASWYRDPWDNGQLRYWDGLQWTGHTVPNPVNVRSSHDWRGKPRRPRFQLSGPLVDATHKMLFADRSMVLLLLCGGVLAAVAGLAVLAPSMLWLDITPSFSSDGLAGVLVAGGALGAATFIMQLVTGAVVAAAVQRAEGGEPTVRGALAMAWTRRRQILAWAALSTLIGAVTRMLERFGIGGLLGALTINLGWAVATVFAMPVVIVEGTMPLETIRRSATLLKDNFSTTIISNVKLSLPWLAGLWMAAGAVLTGSILLTFGSGSPGAVTMGALILVVGVVGVAICGVVSAALSSYLHTYIYRYAMSLPVPGVDPQSLPPRQTP